MTSTFASMTLIAADGDRSSCPALKNAVIIPVIGTFLYVWKEQTK